MPETRPADAVTDNGKDPHYVAEIYAALERIGDRPALDNGVDGFTGHGLVQRSRDLAATLNGHYGVTAGTAVAALGWNNPSLLALQLAVHHLGGRLVAVHPSAPPSEQAAFLRATGASLVVIEGESFEAAAHRLAPMLPPDSVAASLRPLEGFDWLGPAGTHPPWVVPALHDGYSTVLYTSGTAGRPKRVLHGPGLYRAAIELTRRSQSACLPDDRHLVCTPITQGGTQVSVLISLLQGAAVELRREEGPDELLDIIRQRKVTTMFVFPPKLCRLLDAAGSSGWRPPPTLRLLTYGGGPTPSARIVEAERLLCPQLSQVYGLSEAILVSALGPGEHRDPDRRWMGSCGRLVPGMACQARDEAGQPVGPGSHGELFVRGPFTCLGYLDDSGGVVAADDWLATGDIGRVDQSGCVFIVDRRKDVIITGETSTCVYSQLVEDHLVGTGVVTEAAVIGVPHRVYGEALHAYVVPRPGEVIDTAGLKDTIEASMGPLYRLVGIDICLSLPLTGIGKVDKKALRARHWREPDARFAPQQS